MPAPWIIGNWKQNKTRDEASALTAALAEGLASITGPNVGIAPTFLSLDAAASAKGDRVVLFAQDCAAQDSGAFTGEVGPAMLREAGVQGAIVGHSERRGVYGESNALVAAKVAAVLGAGLRCVLCIGEPLEVREAGDHESHVLTQLSESLSDVSPDLLGEDFIVAYEPVWAIGTGKTASPGQAAAMHRAIRGRLGELLPGGAGRSILYGGSVKPHNAADLRAAGDIDGFLVGGASLDPGSFLDIVRAFA